MTWEGPEMKRSQPVLTMNLGNRLQAQMEVPKLIRAVTLLSIRLKFKNTPTWMLQWLYVST